MSLIQINGLTKFYRMGDSIVHALDGVDLSIEKGEFVAITGASGSGKSTMMHLLGCLDRPTAGTYHLNGKNVGEMSDRELAYVRNQDIGFVFQTFNLINRTTALENVGIPLFYARSSNSSVPARRALERVGLTERVTHTPSELSGGERQRVAIARAIVNDPVLVLADEPTGNLDTRTGKQIMEIFHALNEQGVTIVLVTHELEVAMQTKRIVQMRDGCIVLDQLTSNLKHTVASPAAIPAFSLIPEAEQAAVVVAPSPIPAVDAPHTVPASVPANEATCPKVAMTARLAPGTNVAFGCGLAAPVLLFLTFIGFGVMATVFNTKEFSPDNPPPPAYAVLGLVTLLCLLLSVVSGFIGIFWGRAVLRRIKTVPGEWLGKGRARAAWICGLVTILVPTLMIATVIVRALAKAGQA